MPSLNVLQTPSADHSRSPNFCAARVVIPRRACRFSCGTCTVGRSHQTFPHLWYFRPDYLSGPRPDQAIERASKAPYVLTPSRERADVQPRIVVLHRAFGREVGQSGW